MANTARNGASSAYVYLVDAPFLKGYARGKSPFGQWTSGALGGRPQVLAGFNGYGGAGTRVAAGGGGGTVAGVARAGTQSALLTSPEADWFERMHVLPRAGIDFGNIIAQSDQPYEIYNAYRRRDVLLTSITNNASPGVTLPNLSAPNTIEKETSALDPTSTSNSGGSGLGTLVRLSLRALVDGLPSFDTTIDFAFDTGEELSLPVSGQRVVLVPAEHDGEITETLVFLTDIIASVNGKEQRLELRDNPRQQFSVTYLLEDNDRQRFELLLLDWFDNAFALPLWHEQIELTAAVSVGTTTYPVLGADNVDLRIGGIAMVFADSNTFAVISIVALTPTLITAGSVSAFGYPAGTRICPLRVVALSRHVQGRRYPRQLQEMRCEFEALDNDTGALAGSLTPGFWSTYDGRVLLSDCNFMSDTVDEEVHRRVTVIDNETGVVSRTSDWDRSKRTHQKGFLPRTRAQLMQLRRLLVGLGGRQKAFWIPTFSEDLTVKATLTIGTVTMDVTRVLYTRFAQSREPKKTFRITFADGTSLVREIASSVEIDPTTERLTINTAWPSTQIASDVVRVEFYELVRFDTDSFVIRHEHGGRARVQAPVTVVFDDN